MKKLAARLRQEGPVELNPQTIVAFIVERIEARASTAVVRFGQSEGRLLAAREDNAASIEAAARVLQRQTGLQFSTRDVLRVGSHVRNAFQQADVLGVRRGKLTTAEQLEWADAVEAELLRRTAEGHKPSLNSHYLLNEALAEALPAFLELQKRVSIVSCRDLGPVMSERFGISDAKIYQVPSEFDRRQVDGSYEAALHGTPIWPNFYRELEQSLTVREPGEVFLVGAGLLGKNLCSHIRKKGGIALDLGSRLDMLAGKAIREDGKKSRSLPPGPTETVEPPQPEGPAPGSPLAEFMEREPPKVRQTLGEETALCFVLNRKYLRPLRVLLYSLHKHDTFTRCPIEVITDDRMVAEDAFVRKVAANIEYFEPDQLSMFSTIKGDRISPRSKTDFAPKYTFLKFMNFRAKGYQRHVAMDADMICLKPADEALLALPYDSKAMIEVASSSFPIRDEVRKASFTAERAASLVAAASRPREGLRERGINSGFLVLEGKAISDDVFSGAIRVASDRAYEAEQPATTEVIRRIPGGAFLELPIWYNARRRVFECLGEDYFNSIRDEIVFLHYTPGKPWILGQREADFLDHLWFEYEDESRGWVEDVLKNGRPRP